MVLLLTVLLATPPLALACGPQAQQTATGSSTGQDVGNLVVNVQLFSGGGPPRPPGQAAPTPAPSPLAGALVRVRPDDGSPEIDQTADDQGKATFSLPPGAYTVYLPLDGQSQDVLSQASGIRELPDGTQSLDWTTAQVVANQSMDVSLGITQQLP